MPQHTEAEATFSDIDTISKRVIQPLSCNWIGCTATINCWLTLQKHLQLHCQINAIGSSVKDTALIICQINGCQDFEHHSLVTLKNHINKCHLDLIHIPCPVLGCLHTAAASQSQHSHFLAQHLQLLHVTFQSHLFKPQAFPSNCQLPSPLPLPLDSRFPSYKLIPYISAGRPHGMSIGKGLNSLTQSISSLKVSHNSDDKQQTAKKYMASSTSRCSTFESEDDMLKHVFNDLPHNTSNTLVTQHTLHTPILSDPQIDFMLSAPPSWKLQIDKPTNTPQTVGYSAFIALCQLSQK